MKFVPKHTPTGGSYCTKHFSDDIGCSECEKPDVVNVRHMLTNAKEQPSSLATKNNAGWWVLLCANCKREYDVVVGLMKVVGA